MSLAFCGSIASASPPVVQIDGTPTTGYTVANVSGEIDPGTQEVQVYAEFRLVGSQEGWGERLVESIPADAGPTPVSYEITGLKPGTGYEFRLDAYFNSELHLSPEPNPTASTKLVAAPTVSVEPVTSFTSTSALLSGHINPNAPEPEPASGVVEAAFAVNWRFQCTPGCPGLSGTVAADNAAHEVTADANGLNPGTAYEVELIAENANGEAGRQVTGPVSFSTPTAAPAIQSPRTKSVNATEATVEATIFPGGAPTTYRIEYGPTVAYGQSTAESEPIGSDNIAHEVTATLTGLAPGATYHWRVVATNSVEPGDGPDRSFTTFLAPTVGQELPDGRAYEQVTSTDKGGNSVSGDGPSGAVQAAPDGEAIAFSTPATLPGSEGAQSFGAYLSSRAAAEWLTQGLLPPPTLGSQSVVLGWSENLDSSYVLSAVPGFGSSFLERSSATHQFTRIAPEALDSQAGTSSTGRYLLFESGGKSLPSPGTGVRNVYRWDRDSATVSLVSSLNSGAPPPAGAIAGPYAWDQNATSIGGPRINYYSDNMISADGQEAFFTAAGSAQIYRRVNIGAEQSAITHAGEPDEECTEPVKACTIEVSRSQSSTPDEQPAALLAISESPDPAVFFASSAKLTDEANTGATDGGFDLYRYDVDSGQLTDLAPDGTDPNGVEFRGLLGINATGTRAYFVANGVIGDGAKGGAMPGNCALGQTSGAGECNLYLWKAGGSIPHFIARLDANGDLVQNSSHSDGSDWFVKNTGSTSQTARVSADGEALLFRSQRQLTAYDNDGTPEYYRYDAVSDHLSCVSCDPDGAVPATQPFLTSIRSPTGSIESPYRTRNLSSDGSRVFFETGDKLLPADTNGDGGCPLINQGGSGSNKIPRCQDVYEWEAPGAPGGTCEEAEVNGGCLYLLSSGTSPDPSFFADADESGDNVFIYTSQRLVGQDKDNLVDIYDARVGGGLGAQNTAPAQPCLAAGSCRGSSSPPPAESSPGSASFTEPSPRPRVRCRRGERKVRRHGRAKCVKRRHRARHAHNKGGSK